MDFYIWRKRLHPKISETRDVRRAIGGEGGGGAAKLNRCIWGHKCSKEWFANDILYDAVMHVCFKSYGKKIRGNERAASVPLWQFLLDSIP